MPSRPHIHLPGWLRRGTPVAVEPPAAVAGREPRILATRGAPMPFSKGRMAQALVLAGADPERAYQLAMRIEREVNATAADEIPIDQLHSMVEDILAREEGARLVSRYHGWREVLRLDRPLLLLIGGATGTGKSTLATEIAYRLGISRITSTDIIRQAMRAFFAQELMPELHYSSFDAADGLKIPLPTPTTRTGRSTASSSRRGRWRWAQTRSPSGRCWRASRRSSRVSTSCRAWSRPSSTRARWWCS